MAHRSTFRSAAAALALGLGLAVSNAQAQTPAEHDGAHDFDFVIGDWKAHLRRLPDRLVGSTKWVEYDGVSSHRKLLSSNANLEDFEVRGAGPDAQIKGQTLRLYNPKTREWSIYLLDLEKGTFDAQPVVGHFTGGRGEFYDHETWKGRPIMVRYLWLNLSPSEARMEQAFSADEGKTWETNWICELKR